jgi:hypothetical protein
MTSAIFTSGAQNYEQTQLTHISGGPLKMCIFFTFYLQTNDTFDGTMV